MATPSPEELDAFMHMKNAGTDNRIGLILGIEIPLVVIMVSVVCLRFYARSRINAAVGKDDWTMGIATAIALANTAISCVATRYGAGVHAWNLTLDVIEPGAMLGWIYGLMFIPSVSLTKISICLTYLRIFPGRKDKIFCYGMIIYQVISGTAIFLATMLQCLPINSYWDLTIKDKKCYNQELASQVTSVLNSVSDFAVFLWPAPNIWRIQLPVQQRIALTFVFCLGVIVCVTGVIRIWYYTVYFKSKDVFWSAAVLYIVSDIECNLGIICGSLPEIRPLLSRWLYKSATAANLTSRSRSRRQGGRPTISAPMASPYVVQRIDSNESRLENIPSTESFVGKYQTSYQRLSKTGGLTPISPYAIRYDEKGVIHMQEYPIDIHEYPASASPHSSPETLVQSPLQKHHEIQEAELQRPLHSAMSSHRRYSRPDESLMPRPLQSAMSMNRRYSRPTVVDPEMQRPLQSAMSNHQRYSRPETQATSERGSVEMWVGVERPPTRPAGAF